MSDDLARMPEPTPEQLAAVTDYTVDDWTMAYDGLSWRDDWPTVAEWAVGNPVLHPAALTEIVTKLVPPPPLTDADFDAFAAYSQAWRP